MNRLILYFNCSDYQFCLKIINLNYLNLCYVYHLSHLFPFCIILISFLNFIYFQILFYLFHHLFTYLYSVIYLDFLFIVVLIIIHADFKCLIITIYDFLIILVSIFQNHLFVN